MLTKWDYSPRTEGLRLLHQGHQIATGFFRLNGFIVVPYGSVPPSEHVVTQPDLPYLSIPRFWERVSRLNINLYPDIVISAPADLKSQAVKLLATSPLPAPDMTKLQSLWAKHESRILKEIYKLIPHTQNAIKSITIWPTNFGTNCSFTRCYPNPAGHHIAIWLRADQGIAAIVEAILTSLTRDDVYEHLNGLWAESEIIVDWLLAYSPLASLIKKFDPNLDSVLTIKSTREKQQASLVEKSETFLRKIGAPVVDLTSIRQIDTSQFSPREKQIFELLLAKSPHLVSVDEIGDLLFGDNPDAFSLYAIAKTIQRLRDKLESTGISGSFIQTKRGEGYLLAN